MATQSTTAEILLAAIHRDELPIDPQTLEDFGFKRCRDLVAVIMLFEVYTALVKTCGITHQTLHQWRARGTMNLVGEINRELEANKHRIDKKVYTWFYLNDRTIASVSLATGTVIDVRPQSSLSMHELNAQIRERMPDRQSYVEMMKGVCMADPATRKKIEAGIEDLSAIVNQAADKVYGRENVEISDQAANEISITGTTTDTLLAHIAARKDSPELQHMTDYAMSRCHFAPERKRLLKVYTHLLSTCGVKPATLHTWNAQGLKPLGQKIKTEFIKKQDSLPAGLVEFVTENQWIWDADDADGESRALFRTPDLAVRFKDMLPHARAINRG
ncbi:hypothetical protein CkaCkLH20_07279 [Colletotrichum karsti]|uniref:Uncharacterized protein n=1 Tax=Colletotrichum karsti TaxID=1095194 RepID=A0A9P6LGQ0_9PEZI|nr:uncharacterized protein CkaCkLH20_07279 [Colletotrichum karsti]KAF9875459.1 hypothetical protein CkaCkLH20_07279 [Colletotrichum karsti]